LSLIEWFGGADQVGYKRLVHLMKVCAPAAPLEDVNAVMINILSFVRERLVLFDMRSLYRILRSGERYGQRGSKLSLEHSVRFGGWALSRILVRFGKLVARANTKESQLQSQGSVSIELDQAKAVSCVDACTIFPSVLSFPRSGIRPFPTTCNSC